MGRKGKMISIMNDERTIKNRLSKNGVKQYNFRKVTFFSFVLLLLFAFCACGTTGKIEIPCGEEYIIENENLRKYDSLEWTSDDETIAAVKNGKITGVFPGTAKITAAANDQIIDTFTVTVYHKPKIIDVPYLSQIPQYLNACESVSTVMALQYVGINMSVDEFIDKYLDIATTVTVNGIGPDPDFVYCGTPRLKSGWGCYSPVIEKALNKFVNKNYYTVSQFYGKSLEELCHTYIDHDIPVILWATVDMVDSSASGYYAHWTSPAGKTISYNKKLHCLLLVGYDENNYYFNDPMRMGTNGVNYTGYSKKSVEKAYGILNMQCVVVSPK